ncbi:NAD(P)-dependent oxidoreductase [Gluconacetobacter tumulicola]|nr:NAD(P)-dependent oxidoreductase [Gluconacetobacter tumulicola]
MLPNGCGRRALPCADGRVAPPPSKASAHFAGPEALEPFLNGTDILVCLLPNTPSTRHIIDAGLLARLRPGGGVVNVARGDHLVVDDLIQALESGHLAGAVLDVFDHEPLPPSSPLWDHPRITVTPHVASEAPIADRARYILDVIAQIARGDRPALTFDPTRGY